MFLGPFATLPKIMSHLVASGPDAFLEESAAPYAKTLLNAKYDVFPHERSSYGDAAAWASLESAVAVHGERLRALADGHSRGAFADNAARVAKAYGT